MNSDFQAICNLIGDESYRELLQLEPRFNLFDALDVSLRENPSSRILSYLLSSDEAHGLGTAFLETWLDEVFLERAADANSDRTGQGAGEFDARLLGLLQSRSARSQAQVEWSPSGDQRRLDILIRLFNESGETEGVIGVENKHWAAEQENQVGDYQRALKREFKQCSSNMYVLFLSPSGSRAETGAAEGPDRCPYIRCSYRTVLSALRRVEPRASAQVALFLSSTREYLADNLEIADMSDEASKARELVHSLLRNPGHRAALELIQKHSPTGRQLAFRVDDLVQARSVLKQWRSLVFDFYPRKGSSRICEAKWYFSEHEKRLGFVPVLMLKSLDNASWASNVKIGAGIVVHLGSGPDGEPSKESIRRYQDPSMSAADIKDWTWWEWTPLVVSKKSHPLAGMLEDDAKALFDLLEGLLTDTETLLGTLINSEGGQL